jgi:hypothetical protein
LDFLIPRTLHPGAASSKDHWARFYVLAVTYKNMSVFWDVGQCCLAEIDVYLTTRKFVICMLFNDAFSLTQAIKH